MEKNYIFQSYLVILKYILSLIKLYSFTGYWFVHCNIFFKYRHTAMIWKSKELRNANSKKSVKYESRKEYS